MRGTRRGCIGLVNKTSIKMIRFNLRQRLTGKLLDFCLRKNGKDTVQFTQKPEKELERLFYDVNSVNQFDCGSCALFKMQGKVFECVCMYACAS